MTTLLKISIATLLFAIVVGVFVFAVLFGTSDPTKESDDVGIFPEPRDRPVEVEKPPKDTPPVRPNEAGPTTTESLTLPQHQLDQLREIIANAQPVPAPSGGGERWYFLTETPMYRLHVVVRKDGTAVVDMALLQAPYYVARRHAESVFSELFGGERDDLCGFPFYVHVDSDPAFKERGNLGLEHCGANLLAESE